MVLRPRRTGRRSAWDAVLNRARLGVAVMFCIVPHWAWSTPDVSVTKRVTPPVAQSGEPVEFQIDVVNAGSDTAPSVALTEALPTDLEVVPGMAVFVSQGSYDPAGGQWDVGDLGAGSTATMTLPAQWRTASPPPCAVNTASLTPIAGDRSTDDDVATASVRRPGVDACVDLVIENVLFSVPQPFCSDQTSASVTVFVRNRGPDPALDVALTLQQTPERLPGLRFADSDCAGLESTRCELGQLPAGALRVVEALSDSFDNRTVYALTLHFEAVGAEPDYVADDNVVSVVREVPVTQAPPCDIPAPGAIGSPSCFIATAAWGAPWDDNVQTLRDFRDRHLMRSAPGRAFVAGYYRYSPPVAAFIADKPALRAATRAALTPVVYAIHYPAAAIGLLAAGAVLCALCGKRRVGAAIRVD